MTTERQLKVSTHATPSRKRWSAPLLRPSLLLQGQWLADAGIMPGDVVSLTVSNGAITITKF